jgi:hypothetical protein
MDMDYRARASRILTLSYTIEQPADPSNTPHQTSGNAGK